MTLCFLLSSTNLYVAQLTLRYARRMFVPPKSHMRLLLEVSNREPTLTLADSYLRNHLESETQTEGAAHFNKCMCDCSAIHSSGSFGYYITGDCRLLATQFDTATAVFNSEFSTLSSRRISALEVTHRAAHHRSDMFWHAFTSN